MSFGRRIGGLLRAPSGMTGAALFVGVLPQDPGLGPRLVLLVVGWLYGRLLGALVRASRLTPGAWPLAGLILGPAPASLLLFRLGREEHGAVVALGALLGLLVGTIEWAHQRWLDRRDPGPA
jgi:hypothetical protein